MFAVAFTDSVHSLKKHDKHDADLVKFFKKVNSVTCFGRWVFITFHWGVSLLLDSQIGNLKFPKPVLYKLLG